MSIAQLSVAGEGEAHLSEIDESAAHEYTCDNVNLHWVIFRAAYRAARIPGLPRRACDLLAALARTVDKKKPAARIFIGRDRLTERARQSKRTLYRSLEDLAEAGLIVRGEQLRDRENQFDRAYLYLSEAAIRLLGYLDDLPDRRLTGRASARAKSAEAGNDAAEKADYASAEPQQDSPCANLADRIQEDLSPDSFQKRQSGNVPADLQRLRGLGFSDFLIFKLMRQAGEARKRLSDVVEVTWPNLQKAKRPICYLGALLRNPVDFSHQLRQRSAAKAEAEARKNRASQAQESAKENAGKIFEHIDGKSRYTIDSTGEHLSVYSYEEGVDRQATNWEQGFADALAAGRLREVTGVNSGAHVPVPVARIEPRAAVTSEDRQHVAALRDVLKAALSGQKNKAGKVGLESIQPRGETARFIASPV
ncbi:Replication protein O [Paraburkholderia adhaesiva]|uniref:Replication protein O n=1 Tax=Paraburkholderia adhaesiva TaxID=2883244 RepID=UPI001F36043A|nr:Replication protein O [Paraburkholderia adhaesiva]